MGFVGGVGVWFTSALALCTSAQNSSSSSTAADTRLGTKLSRAGKEYWLLLEHQRRVCIHGVAEGNPQSGQGEHKELLYTEYTAAAAVLSVLRLLCPLRAVCPFVLLLLQQQLGTASPLPMFVQQQSPVL